MRSALVPILLADPLPWAQKAEYAWDFLRDRARFGGRYRGVLANTPGWTFTRASTGYYTTTGGVLVPFASGSLRTGDRGALIEGAGTNLCLQSQTFDNVSWSKTRASVSANAAVAPDGTTTADTLVEDTSATTTHFLTSSAITITADSTVTVSIYAKASTRSWLRLQGSDNTESNLFGTYFNLSTGAIGTTVTGGVGSLTSASISALGNGWYRCVVTGVIGAGSTIAKIGCKLADADNSASYTGDGTSGIYLWGAQLEATAYASSYIPTTTGSATRAADSLTVTGVSGLDYPLTLYAEWEPAAVVGSFQGTLQVDSASNDRALLTMGSGALAQMYAQDGGVYQVNNTIAGAMAVGTVYKHAARFAANDSQHARGGTLGTQDTSCSMPSAPTTIRLGSQTSSTSALYGYLRRAAIWSRALSDAELQAVST